jgi:hypothetical protein
MVTLDDVLNKGMLQKPPYVFLSPVIASSEKRATANARHIKRL